jgi:hypothetical protein
VREMSKPRFKTRRHLGSVALHNANAIYPSGLKLRIDRGKVYFDVDTLEEAGGYPAGNYLHIGVSGDWKVEEVASQDVKGHMDIYMPLQLDELIDMFIRLKVEESM